MGAPKNIVHITPAEINRGEKYHVTLDEKSKIEGSYENNLIVAQSSGNWDSTYSTVSANSGIWNLSGGGNGNITGYYDSDIATISGDVITNTNDIEDLSGDWSYLDTGELVFSPTSGYTELDNTISGHLSGIANALLSGGGGDANQEDIDYLSGQITGNSTDIATISGDVITNTNDIEDLSGDWSYLDTGELVFSPTSGYTELDNTISGHLSGIANALLSGGGGDANQEDIDYLSGQITGNSTDINTISGDVDTNTNNITDLSGDWSYADTLELVFSPTSGYTELDNTISGHLSGIANALLSGGGGIESGSYIPLSGSNQISGSLIPTLSSLTLGTSANPWQEIYATSGSIHLGDDKLGSISGLMNWNDEPFVPLTRTPTVNDDKKLIKINVINYGDVGDGSDGDLVVNSSDVVVNNYAGLSGDYNSNDNTITVDSFSQVSEFAAGDEIMIIQTQVYRCGESYLGKYEFQTISSINGNNITLTDTLANSYYSDADGDKHTNTKAQIVTVPHYNTVEVQTGYKIHSTPWNGYYGGIVVLRCKGEISGNGIISAKSEGYRLAAAGDYSGEGYQGIGIYCGGDNFGGGGGGGAESGGHAIQRSYYGTGGRAFGTDDLKNELTFGGGGGSNAFGGQPGESGGGIVALFASVISITKISAGALTFPLGAGAGGSVVIVGADMASSSTTIEIDTLPSTTQGSYGFYRNYPSPKPKINFDYSLQSDEQINLNSVKTDSVYSTVGTNSGNWESGGSGSQKDIDYLSGQVSGNLTDIATISGDVITNTSNIENLSGDFQSGDTIDIDYSSPMGYTEITGNISGHLSGISNSLNTLGEVSGNISANTNDIDYLSGQITGNSTDITTISGDVITNTNDIEDLSGDWSYADTLELVFSPTSGYTELDNTISGHLSGIANALLSGGGGDANQEDIDYLSGQITGNSTDIATISGDVIDNTNDINYLSGQITGNSTDINTISGDVDTNTNNITDLSGDWSYADTLELVFSPTSGYTELDNTISGHLSGIANAVLFIDSQPSGNIYPGIQGQSYYNSTSGIMFKCVENDNWVAWNVSGSW